MSINLQCTNKECGKFQPPYIDPKTDKVYCSVCDEEMLNISHFTKIQLKATKQFKQKQNTSYSVKCKLCGKEDRPIIQNDDVLCSKCKKPLSHLSYHYKLMLKERIPHIKDD